ncbi:HEAT repeat-containing protein protein, putative [Babesia ovis]|uniref:HEAT repeat-containing protein protein, putative n=1 Tax=Babesia ovis TaxID=5869 RepID=A0A9W5TBE1_BABOV|nr:HEAT repeat-containing protein protein, putative [Babesia ovis]
MTSLFRQLEALSATPNKAYTRFRRSYASTEHYNRVLVRDSWEYLLGLDSSLIDCECLFRRCISDSGPLDTSDGRGSNDHQMSPVPAWATKEIDFMVESELKDCERVLQRFMDSVTSWLLHEPCQHLIDYLIYQYELSTRFGDMLVLALLPIHESSYFVKTAELITLPEGSELSYYLPPNVTKDHSDGNQSAGVSRATIIAATVKYFSNYKRISDTVERIVLLRKRGGAYVPLYNLLSLAFVEQNRNNLGDAEVRLLLNSAFSGLKHPEHGSYYSAQLCILTVLFTTVTVTLSVQKSVVTAMFDPLLPLITSTDVPSLELRLRLKDCLLVLLGMLHQQKERLDVLPVGTTRHLLTVLHKFPALVNMFRATSGSSESLDFSRLCKLLTLSVVKACKQHKSQDADATLEKSQVQLIQCLVDFFSRLDHSILYMRVMLYTLIDDLVAFYLSCQQGEALFQWDPSIMSITLNPNHEAKLEIYSDFFRQLHSISPSVFEDVLRRVLQPQDRSAEILPVFLMICHSVSHGSPLHFSVLVHRCLGKPVDNNQASVPTAVSGDNLGSTLLLYADANLPSKTRVQLYSMISSIVDINTVSSLDFNVLREFIRVSLADPECNPLFCTDAHLVDMLPPTMVADALLSHISGVLTGSGLSFSMQIVFKVKNKCPLLDLSNFYDKCFEMLNRDHAMSQQLLHSLALFVHVYARTSGPERDSLHRASYHFMCFLRMVQLYHRPLKGGKKASKHSDVPAESSSVEKPSKGSSTSRRQKKSAADKNAPKVESVVNTNLEDICNSYFGSEASVSRNYDASMSLMVGILDFMAQLSTATMYINTSSGDVSVSGASSSSILVRKDCLWLNEWMVCYGLYEACELLRLSTQSATGLGNAGDSEDSDNKGKPSAVICENPMVANAVLTPEQFRNLFSLTEVVLCYAIKLYRESIMFGELTFSFARCSFKLMTLYTLLGCMSVKSEDSALGPICDLDLPVDRDTLLLHTMLALSSEEFTSLFKESLSMAPKAALPHISIWLKHYFEFGRFALSAEKRPGIRLDLYGNISSSYVEISKSSMKLTLHGVLSDVTPLGLSMLSELLNGVVEVPQLPTLAQPSYQEDIATLRVPFISLLELDSVLRMYSRCMDTLSHLVCELLHLKTLNNSCLMLDLMANTLEFLVDKDHHIRRAAVSMLSRAMQAYVEVPCKSPLRFISICGYHLSLDYTTAVSKLEPPLKGLEKSLKRFCTALLASNAPLPNVMFVNQLVAQCANEPMVACSLLYWIAYSGTSLQFNADVIKQICDGLPEDTNDIFTQAIIGTLPFIKSAPCDSKTQVISLLRYLVLFVTSTYCVAISNLRGKNALFATTICPEVFTNVSAVYNRLSGLDDTLQLESRAVRHVTNLCAAICTYPLSGSGFWTLKPDVHQSFLTHFDQVFDSLDVTTRRSCLHHIASGYDSSKWGVKPLVALLPRLQSCREFLREKFFTGIIDNSSSNILSGTFSGMLQHEKSTKSWFKMSFMILQRYITSADLGSEQNLSFLFKSVMSLLDNVFKMLKAEQDNSTSDASLSQLSHVAVFINELYRRFAYSMDIVDAKMLRKVDTDISRCLRSLCQLFGAQMLEFVQPFLCKICIVKTYLDSTSDAMDGNTQSKPSVSHSGKNTGSNGCASMCQLLVQIFDNDRSTSTMLRFVDLCEVLHNVGTRDTTLFDEWLCYSIYCSIYICRLDCSSPVLARCMELLKQSNDPVGILAKLLFTALSQCCNDDSNLPLWVPRLDVRCLNLSKNLGTSKFEPAYGIYDFITNVVKSLPDLIEIPIDADSFSNYKSIGYRRYKSLSLLLQGTSISVVCFKNYSEDQVSSLNKKRKGLMGICSANSEDSGNNDCLGPSILKKARDIDALVYTANPRDNYSRLTLGSLLFFSGVDRDAVETNFWSDACNIDFAKQPWVCEYISVAIGSISKLFGQKQKVENQLLPGNAKYNRELSTMLMRLSKVLADFITASDPCVMSKRLDDAVVTLVNGSRKSVWRTLLGMSASIRGAYAEHCFGLANSRIELLRHSKTLLNAAVADFVNSLKLCITLVKSYEVSSENLDLEFVYRLSKSLAMFTAYVLDRHPANINLMALVLVAMLLLRRTFGNATGDELLEAILNLLVFLKVTGPVDDRFPLPPEDSVLKDTAISSACADVFNELLQCNPDKVSTLILENSNVPCFIKAIPTRTATLLSFYASVSCKYYHLLRLVLNVDFSKVIPAMRNGGRLISLVAISLHYNRVKSKYLQDLERLYFLNANLLSDFESASIDALNRKARKAAKANKNTDSGTPPHVIEPSGDATAMLAQYLQDHTGSPRLDLSCRIFHEHTLEFGSDDGVKCFEDLAIVFALEYFAKIKPSDLVEVLSNHINMLNATGNTKNTKGGMNHDSTRLLLRLVVATLKEYGSVGATQFVLPRVYEFLNSVLDSTVDELCHVNVGTKKSKSTSLVAPRWKCFANAVFALRAMGLCVETWDSKQASVPDMCLNKWLPTLGKALGVFDVLSTEVERQYWSRALENTFLHLVVSCSSEADRIERVLSGDLVSRSETCKCQVLGIMLSLWGKASFHLGSSMVNVMPVLGELADDESSEVQRLAEMLNDKIQSFLNME